MSKKCHYDTGDMNKEGNFMNKNGIIALTLLSAMGVTSTTSVLNFTNPIVMTQAKSTNTGTVVMDSNTDFRYLDTGADPADGTQAKDKWGQYTGWTRAYKNGDNASLNGYYNDNDWQYTKGEFSTDETTSGYQLNKDSQAYFFRGRFQIDKASDIKGIHLNFDYKDAVIVYINGQQLTSLNVPDEGYRTNGDASGSHKDNLGYGSQKTYSEKQTADLYFRDISDMLVDGENIIAIELHKTNAQSSAYFKMNELSTNPDENLLPQRDALKAISLSVGRTSTELNLNWFSLAKDGGTVQYAKKSDMTGKEFPVEKAKTVNAKTSEAQAESYYANKATLQNLQANTEYVYRVGNHGEWSDIYSTTTKSNDKFSFLFAGDPQLGSSGDLTSDKDGWKNTLNLVKTNPLFKDVHFIQNAGDHVEAGKNESQYDAYLSNYEGSVVYSTPFANAVGNHDYKGTAYNDHFNLPNVSQLGDSGEGNAQGDYYYVYNNTLMLVLNSNNRSTAEHEEFIQNTIEKTKNNKDIQWKIVVFHHSIYSSASHASDTDILDRRSTLAPMFKEMGIDVVLMGHDHVYTRSMLMDGLTPMKEESFDDKGQAISEVTDPTGITYITANSASGSKYYEFTDKLQGDYIAVKNQEHVANITKLNVSDGELKIVTYRTSDMSVVDEFTIHKTLDKSDLQLLIKEVKELDKSQYTEESYAVLQTALTRAEELIAKSDINQKEIDQALADLQSAKANLKTKTVVNPNDNNQKPNDNNQDLTQTENPDHKTEDPQNITNPQKTQVQTADNTSLVTWLAVAGIASLVGVTVYITQKKQKEN